MKSSKWWNDCNHWAILNGRLGEKSDRIISKNSLYDVSYHRLEAKIVNHISIW